MYIPIKKAGMSWCIIGIKIETRIKSDLVLQLHTLGLRIA